MSRENVELVRSIHIPSGTDLVRFFREQDSEGDPGVLAEAFDPDVEVFGGTESGIALTATGLPGLVEAWREWLSPWEVYRTEVEEFIDAGDDRVVVLVRDHGRLRGSESEVENVGASVWTVRDGRIARVEFHASRDEGLAAAGMSAGR